MHAVLALTGTHNNVPGYYGIGRVYGGVLAKDILTKKEILPTNGYRTKYYEDKQRYETNREIIGFSHVDEHKDTIKQAILDAVDKVQELKQLKFLMIAGLIKSDTLAGQFERFKSSIHYYTRKEFEENLL